MARIVAAPVLRAVRATDSRAVVWTPPALGGGNHLYMWMHAWQERQAGRETWILRQPGMEPWVEMFPALADLTIDRDDVPFRADRPVVWNQAYDRFGRAQLDTFCDAVLLSSERFQGLLTAAWSIERPALTLNIRRGDYYTASDIRSRYGMDLRAYLDEALALHRCRPEQVEVVSDDPAWCTEVLGAWIPGAAVTTIAREHGMMSDLAHLVTARTLVLTNSTFSYWSGYLKERLDTVHGRDGQVIAPRFHVRTIDDGVAWQLSPTWRVVDNVAVEMAG